MAAGSLALAPAITAKPGFEIQKPKPDPDASHPPGIDVAAIALSSVTTEADSKHRVAIGVTTPTWAKTLDRLIR